MAERGANWDDRLEYAALSDIGMRRSNNQDAMSVVLASDPEVWEGRGHLFMVADGMGAHAAGELASKLAVDGVSHRYHKYTELSAPEALHKAIVETNSEIHRRGQANPDFRNMGTTASMLLLLPQGALIAHVGDSRVYRLRDDRLEQLTFDHSLVWELWAAGQLSDGGDLAHSVPRNVITRSLGPNPSVQIDFEGLLDVRVGDVFLLCSDGLTGRIEDEELALMLANLPPDEATRLMVDLANLRGGPDNITAIVSKILEPMCGDAAEPRRTEAARVKPRRPMHPAVWVAMAVFLLIALVHLITDRLVWAAGAVAIAGAVYLGGLLLSGHWASTRGGLFREGRFFGRAPYAVTRCPRRKNAVRLLARVTQNLRQCEAPADIPLDWTAFDACRQSAAETEQRGGLDEAIRRYAKAIRDLMQQVREAQSEKSSDSAIDY